MGIGNKMEAEITQTKLDGYMVDCPLCNKTMKALTWKQLNSNYAEHHKSCKKRNHTQRKKDMSSLSDDISGDTKQSRGRQIGESMPVDVDNHAEVLNKEEQQNE